MKLEIALAISIATIGLVVVRPRNLSEAVSSLGGAALMVALGVVPVNVAALALLRQWNVFLFFFGLMIVAGLAEQAGVFEWLAGMAVHYSRGSARRLFILVAMLVVIVTILLTNDTSALVLTPIVYALVLTAGVEPLPYLFATTFLANAASLFLPISNPLNFIVANNFGISLSGYVSVMLLPGLAATLMTGALLLYLFRRGFATQPERSSEGLPAISGPAGQTLVLLALLLGGYLVASAFSLPLGLVPLPITAVMLAVSWTRKDLDLRSLESSMTWSIFGFFGGMVIIVRGLQSVGTLHALATSIVRLGGGSLRGTVGVTGVAAAIGANVINNLPMAVGLVATLHEHLRMSPPIHRGAIYATIIGADLGPNLMYIGSLSSMFWVLLLRRRGMQISAMDYLRLGCILTPPALAAALFTLIVVLG